MFRPTLPRAVVHHARPTRVPLPRSPFAAYEPRPTEGASVPRPQALVGPTPASTSKVELDSGLALHHAPPPTAPSYTQGLPTPFTSWLRGQQVALTGEEAAPLLHAEAAQRKPPVAWTQEQIAEMQRLRKRGQSKAQVAQALSIPKEQIPLISRVAPLSRKQREGKEKQLANQKASWGERKQIQREIRQKRREFW